MLIHENFTLLNYQNSPCHGYVKNKVRGKSEFFRGFFYFALSILVLP